MDISIIIILIIAAIVATYVASSFFNKPSEKLEEPEKPEVPKTPKSKPDWAEPWEAFCKTIPVGTKIEYLGIEMVVVRKGGVYCLSLCDGPSWGSNGIMCQYIDGNGIIQKQSFDRNNAAALIKIKETPTS